MVSIPVKTGAWTPEEDAILAAMQKKVGNHWSTIAQHIEGRTGQQCAQRWRHKVNPNIRKEKWTAEEDQLLEQLVNKFGTRWAEIARRCNGRTDQQCMGRWRRHLDPEIKRDSWTSAEDASLIKMQRLYPSQWSRISQYIPGRTAQQCRARFFQVKQNPGLSESQPRAKRGRSSPTMEDLDQELAELEEEIKVKPMIPPAKKPKKEKAASGKKASGISKTKKSCTSAPLKKRKSRTKAIKNSGPSQSFSAASDQSSLGHDWLQPSVPLPLDSTPRKIQIKPEALRSQSSSEQCNEETSALTSIALAPETKFVTPKKEESRSKLYEYSPPPPFSGIPLFTPPQNAVGGVGSTSASILGSPHFPFSPLALPRMMSPSPYLENLMWKLSPSVNFTSPAGLTTPSIFASGCTTPGSSAAKAWGIVNSAKPCRSGLLHVPGARSATPNKPLSWPHDLLTAIDNSKSCIGQEATGVKRRLAMTPATAIDDEGRAPPAAASAVECASDVPIKPLDINGAITRIQHGSAFHEVQPNIHADLFSAVSESCATPIQFQQSIAHAGRPSLTPITSTSMAAGTTLFATGRPSICSVNDHDKEALAVARMQAERRLSTAASQDSSTILGREINGSKNGSSELPSPLKLEIIGMSVTNKENSNPGRDCMGSAALTVSSAQSSHLALSSPKRVIAETQSKIKSSAEVVAHSRSRLNALLSLEDALA